MVEAVYRIYWTEYERDWGSKPNGHTDYDTLTEAKQAIVDHWDKYPNRSIAGVPDYYIAPSEPTLVEVGK